MVCFLKRLSVACWLLISASAAQSSPELPSGLPTIFGIPLGQPIALPKCTFDFGEPTCVTLDTVKFENNKEPSLLRNGMVGIRLIDGNVEMIGAQVLGDANRLYVIHELTAKFGLPTKVRREAIAPHGIPFSQTVADWNRKGYSVHYESYGGDLQTGFLKVLTAKATIADKAADNATDANRVKM